MGYMPIPFPHPTVAVCSASAGRYAVRRIAGECSSLCFTGYEIKRAAETFFTLYAANILEMSGGKSRYEAYKCVLRVRPEADLRNPCSRIGNTIDKKLYLFYQLTYMNLL
ncbi:MAG: hypothetical protein LBK69_07085 [Syntrophomonadaceae bacterium]|jgi:hypothetical protein|nr:hypothetical protein [Syntrophomonadaceae bacterium]